MYQININHKGLKLEMCPRVYVCENVNVLAFQVKNIRTSALDLCGQASVAHYIALVDAQLCIFMPLQSGGWEERE